MFVGSGVRSPGEFDVLVHLPFKVNPSFDLLVGIIRYCLAGIALHPTGGLAIHLKHKKTYLTREVL